MTWRSNELLQLHRVCIGVCDHSSWTGCESAWIGTVNSSRVKYIRVPRLGSTYLSVGGGEGEGVGEGEGGQIPLNNETVETEREKVKLAIISLR